MVEENNKTEGCRERERELQMFFPPQTQSFTQLTHVHCSTNALMEINQSDITPTLVTGQHRFFSTLCVSCSCHLSGNLPLQICISPTFVPLLSHPVFPPLAPVVSPPITNATPLTRYISPPLSHPLPRTSFAQE